MNTVWNDPSTGERRDSKFYENCLKAENPIKISDILSLNAPITEELAEAVRKTASDITEKKGKSNQDKEWMRDFVKNYDTFLTRKQDMVSLEEEVASLLNTRRHSSEPPRPSIASGSRVSEPRRAPKIKLNELVIKPATFDGVKPPARTWLDDFERASEANQWEGEDKLTYFPTFLERTARDWWVTVARRKFALIDPSWNDVKAAFKRHFLGATDKLSLRRQIDNTFQRENESATTFIPRILRLLELADPNRQEEQLVEIIRDKLRNVYQAQLAMRDIFTVESLNDECIRVEAGIAASKEAAAREARMKTPKPSTSFNNNKTQNAASPSEQQRRCYRCDRKTHLAIDCRAKARLNGEPCRPRKSDTKRVNIVRETDNQGEDDLSGDEEVGEDTQEETRDEEEDVNSAEEDNDSDDTRNVAIVQAREAGLNYVSLLVGGGSMIYQEIYCNSVKVRAIVDTGAYYSIVHADLARKYQWPVKRDSLQLTHAAGENLLCLGNTVAKLRVQIGQEVREVECKLIIVDKLCTPFLMGLELIKKFNLQIVPNANPVLSFAKAQVGPKAKGVRAGKQIVPPRCVSLIQAKVETDAKYVLTSAFNFDQSLTVANSIAKVTDNMTTVMLINIDSKPVTISENQQIASFEPYQEQSATEDRVQSISCVLPLAETSEVVQVGAKLTEAQRQELSEVLNANIDAFSIGGELGRATNIEHDIELLPGAEPFTEPMRRHPELHRKEVDKQVKEMLKKGVIENSSSPWASEYVVVKKKTGDYRVCVDFRRLNKMTKKNCYPLPNVEACLEALANKCYFSKLDFASGYWQLPMAQQAREFTAFRTDQGLFQFKVMPFGLCNGPASFQKLINMLFSGLRGLSLQVFLDDICIATTSWAEHLQLLQQVFKITTKANLKLKGSKCIFGSHEMLFLGHKITSEGIQQDPSKLRALADLPAPNDVSSVRRALGAFGYYRRFVPKFAEITQPISMLTKKNARFQWGAAQQQAFQDVKSILLKDATLAFLNPTGRIRLKTDASGYGIAGLLLQEQQDVWRMVACCSRGLTPSEANYASTDMEGLAIVYSLQKFRHYLLGRKFEILTDNCALCVLNKRLPDSNRLKRWAIVLSEYDFQVVYVKGAQHLDVDCLSRAPVASEPDEFLDKILLVIPVNKAQWVGAYQAEDQQVLRLAEATKRGYRIEGGVVYRRNKLYVPFNKRQSIISESHDAMEANHDGINGTLGRMRQLCWPNMVEEVTHYIKTCHTCQLRKVERAKPGGFMKQHTAEQPLDLVSFDMLGPLPATDSGDKFVLVGIDVFTKFVMARAVPARTSVSFRNFLSEFIATLGVPKRIVTDNGMEFCNKEVYQMTALLQIEHVKAVPRYSQGNAPAERVIQSIQEKLSVLINNREELDWAAALPLALVGLNTKIHKTTKYSPYQLMLGRAPPPVQASLCTDEPPMSAAQREERVECDRQKALESYNKAHSTSKPYFDAKRQQREFSVGELVTVRRSDRAPKLLFKFEGPFEIIKKEKDIYTVSNVARKDIRKRHISQLKPYNMRALLGVALVLIGTSAQALPPFQEALPIYWVEEPQRFVSEGDVTLPYDVHFVSPCKYILHYELLLVTQFNQAAFNKTEQHRKTNLIAVDQRAPSNSRRSPTLNPAPLAVPRVQANQVLRPVLQTAAGPTPIAVVQQPVAMGPVPIAEQVEYIELHDDSPAPSSAPKGEYLSKEELLAKGITPPNGKRSLISNQANVLFNSCETSFANFIVQTVKSFNITVDSIEKRQLQFIAGFVLDNFIHLIKKEFSSDNNSPELKKLFQDSLKSMDSSINLMGLALKAAGREITYLAGAVEAVQVDLTQLPSLQSFHNFIINEMNNKKSLLLRLKTSMEQKKPDTITLAQLFGAQKIGPLELRDANFIQATGLSGGELRMTIAGPIRSENTKVYEVKHLSFHTGWTGTPLKHSYVGATLVAKNFSSNCVKELTAAHLGVVTLQCVEANYSSPNLKLWESTPCPGLKKEDLHSISLGAWPYHLVYCVGHDIEVSPEDRGFETSRCPVFPFKLPDTWSFKTSDQLVKHLFVKKSKTIVTITYLDVGNYHFTNFTYAHDEIDKNHALIQNLTSANEELDRHNTLMELGDIKITHRHSSSLLTMLLGLVVLSWALYMARAILYCRPISFTYGRRNRVDTEDRFGDQLDQRFAKMLLVMEKNNERMINQCNRAIQSSQPRAGSISSKF